MNSLLQIEALRLCPRRALDFSCLKSLFVALVTQPFPLEDTTALICE